LEAVAAGRRQADPSLLAEAAARLRTHLHLRAALLWRGGGEERGAGGGGGGRGGGGPRRGAGRRPGGGGGGGGGAGPRAPARRRGHPREAVGLEGARPLAEGV